MSGCGTADDDGQWSCYDGIVDDSATTHRCSRLLPRLCDILVKDGFIARGAQGALYRAHYRDGCAPAALREGGQVTVKRLFVHHFQVRERGWPISHVREVSILRSLSHPNIIKVIQVVEAPHQEPCLVMEPVQMDLDSLVLKSGIRLTGSHLKYVVQQLLGAVQHLASKHIVHRDIKPSNIGVTRDGQIKLIDFGSSRLCSVIAAEHHSPVSTCTTLVFSPPEQLLGERVQSSATDIWGVGVVMAELARGRRLFDARTQLELLSKIFHLVGTPTPEDWPDMQNLSSVHSFRFEPQRSRVAEIFVVDGVEQKYLSPAGANLLALLLHPSPACRITAEAALRHPWFTQEHPSPCTPQDFAPLLSAVSAHASQPHCKARVSPPMNNIPLTFPDSDDEEDIDGDGESCW